MLKVLSLLSMTMLYTPPGVEPLFAPDLLRQDVPHLLSVFQADDQQAIVFSQLVDDYIDASKRAASAARAQIQAASGAESMTEDWSDYRQAWLEVRQAAAAIEDVQVAGEYLRSQEAWAAAELQRVLEQREALPPSERTVLVDEWMTAQQSAWQRLRRDIMAMSSADTDQEWGRLETAIRRHRPRFAARLPGESINLPAILRDACRGETDTIAAVQGALLAHDQEWSRAVGSRDEALAILTPRQLDAVDRRDRLAQLALARREAVARQAVVDANHEGYDRIVGLLSQDCAEAFRREFNEAMWPSIFSPPAASRISEWALLHGELSDTQRAEVLRLQSRFLSRRLLAAMRERNALRVAGTSQLTMRAEERAMADLFGPTALFGIDAGPSDEALSEAAKWGEERRNYDLEWAAALRRALGADLWSAVPEAVRLPPSALSGELTDESGEPLRFRIVP
ncbi:MAG: hypothetical protein MK100_04485 [Phycisphaerales bacterium]|nr:hypothetical protein [Phycisphaerales bacterium]